MRRMKRGYNTAQFLSAVKRLRAAYPQAAFTTDVIVGFPGETEDEFEETMRFCEKVGFAKLHVFPFSRREGTPAAGMSGQVPESVKDARVRRLIETGERLAAAYREGLVGTVREVLLEERLPAGGIIGYTPEYVHVRVETGEPGAISSVRLDGLTREGMTGTVVE